MAGGRCASRREQASSTRTPRKPDCPQGVHAPNDRLRSWRRVTLRPSPVRPSTGSFARPGTGRQIRERPAGWSSLRGVHATELLRKRRPEPYGRRRAASRGRAADRGRDFDATDAGARQGAHRRRLGDQLRAAIDAEAGSSKSRSGVLVLIAGDSGHSGVHDRATLGAMAAWPTGASRRR